MNPWFQNPLLDKKTPPSVVDVSIIGASLHGLYLSYLLRQAGLKVSVFEERSEVASGFSRRSIGQAQLGLGDNPYRVGLSLGKEGLQKILRFSARSLNLLSQWNGFYPTGGLEIAKDPREEEEIRLSWSISKELGFPNEHWPAKKLQGTLKVPSLLSGRFLPQEGIADLYVLTQNLFQHARQEGVSVHCPIRIHEIQDGNHGQIIIHEQGETRTEVTVYTSGLNIPRLLPYLADKHTTVRAQAIGYKRTTPSHLWGCRAQYGYVYWRDYLDYRLLGGCRWATTHLEQGETDDTITVPKIEDFLRAFAQKDFGEENPIVTYRWSGIEERSCDGLPIIGTLPGRIDTLLCTALQGKELGLGFAGAEAIGELLIHGQSSTLPDIFSPRRFL
ncbi:MAG: FAD-dependent oxidoreductase [Myxococcota bacterium]|nr:FAD-dependent oxidoreductase [Myxococcota bacterium]